MNCYGHISELTRLNPNSESKYPEDGHPIYKAVIKLNRKIKEEHITIGQSVGIFPKNNPHEAKEVIKAFRWKETDLLGNKSVLELLIDTVDIKSEKINLSKLWDSSQIKGADSFAKTLNEAYQDHVTLLDLAREYLSDGELNNSYPVP